MPQSQTQKSCSHPIFENKNVALMALARLPKYIRKNLARQIQKNLRSINWYSYNKLNKTAKFHTFFSFFYGGTFFMARMIQVFLYNAIQDIFKYFSSACTKRGMA